MAQKGGLYAVIREATRTLAASLAIRYMGGKAAG